MNLYLLVFCGGGIGAMLRFMISNIIINNNPTSFPYHTIIINIAGCFLSGLISGYLIQKNPDYLYLKYLLIIGFLGGFTTFSAFGIECVTMLQNQQITQAILYIFSSVFGGIIFALAGWIIMINQSNI